MARPCRRLLMSALEQNCQLVVAFHFAHQDAVMSMKHFDVGLQVGAVLGAAAGRQVLLLSAAVRFESIVPRLAAPACPAVDRDSS